MRARLLAILRAFSTKTLIGGVLIAAGVLTANWVNGDDQQDESAKPPTSGRASKYQQGSRELIDRGGGHGPRYVVPPSRVPRTVSQAQQAPQIELTPSRWARDPEASPTGSDPAQISPADRQELVRAARAFLRRWETFKPGDKERGTYARKLINYTDPAALEGILEREDNHQIPGVCPLRQCPNGSRFLDYVDPAEAASVRDYDGRRAYLTTSGAVRYFGAGDYADQEFYRSYGLVMVKRDGRWLVARAAADTFAPVQ